MGRGAEGQEKPREMAGPVGGGTTSFEGRLQSPVETFYQTIGLWVKSGGVDGDDVQEVGEVRPN
jgi:hypothetical protein